MQLSLSNDVEIYHVTANKSLPDWLSDRRRRRMLKRDKELARQISIIHEFEMPNLSTYVTASPDQKYLFALGTYKPQVKCFEVDNMAEKFTRGVDSLPQKIEFVQPDYSMFWLMEDDRWIEFHTRQGHYFKTRIPKPCRDISFFNQTNELYVTGASDEIYRYSNTDGRFMPPMKSPGGAELTAITTYPYNGSLLCGTVDAKVDLWDPRTRRSFRSLDICAYAPEVLKDVPKSCAGIPEVTCIRFQSNYRFGVGLSSGIILLYDIRMKEPLQMKNHHYGFPIIDFAFHGDIYDTKVVSVDKKCVKIWNDVKDAPTWASFEPGIGINGLHLWEKSGLLHLANEESKLLTYFIPEMGLAPRWCNKIYGLLEECEEQTPCVYDDQKFISRENLENWGLQELIGTEHLRAYMHGFFMKSALYDRLRFLVGPSDREQYKKMKVQEYLQKKRDEVCLQPIGGKRPLINKDLTEDVTDKRFKSLFTDPEFLIDPNSKEADKTQRLRRIKEKKAKKRLKAREKASRSNRILLEDTS